MQPQGVPIPHASHVCPQLWAMGAGGRGGGRARTPENRRVCPPPIHAHHPCHSCMHPHGQTGEGGRTHACSRSRTPLPATHACTPPWANGGGEGWGTPMCPPILTCTPVLFACTPLLFLCAPPPICTHPLPLVHAPPSCPHAPPCPQGGTCLSSHSCAPPPPHSCMHPPPQLWVNRGRGGAHPRDLPSAHAPPSGSHERPSPCSHPERGCTQGTGGGRCKEGKGGCRWWHLHPLPPFSCRGLERGNVGK
jgi:hypothetical protein